VRESPTPMAKARMATVEIAVEFTDTPHDSHRATSSSEKIRAGNASPNRQRGSSPYKRIEKAT